MFWLSRFENQHKFQPSHLDSKNMVFNKLARYTTKKYLTIPIKRSNVQQEPLGKQRKSFVAKDHLGVIVGEQQLQ
jgi:hypothetical protein